MTTNIERVVDTLARWPGLDDDRLSNQSGVKPRQQINQICRLLEARGEVRREVGPEGKIINLLVRKVR